ncbi:transcription-repair coupling factor [bacterium]|nr:transcription-repair coupling factor [bacterium]
MEINELITKSPHIKELKKKLAEGKNLYLKSNLGSFPAYFIAELFNIVKNNILIITPHDENSVHEDLRYIMNSDNILVFPSWDILPYEHKLPDTQITGFRIKTLEKLHSEKRNLIVTSIKALSQPIIQSDIFERASFRLKVGDEIAQDDVIQRLFSAGYQRENIVEFTQTFSRRGGIIDIFTVNYRDPVRVEFWGKTIDSIRLFKASTQRSIASLEEVTILPCREGLSNFDLKHDLTAERIRKSFRTEIIGRYTKEQVENLVAKLKLDRNFPGNEWYAPFFEPLPTSLLDHLGKNFITIMIEPEQSWDLMEGYMEETEEMFSRNIETKLPLLPPNEIFISGENVKKIINDHQLIEIKQSIPKEKLSIQFNLKPPPVIMSNNDLLNHELNKLSKDGYSVFIFCDNAGQIQRLDEILEPHKNVHIELGRINGGFIYPGIKLAVLTDHEIFSRYKRRFRSRWYNEGHGEFYYGDLKKDDLLVHVNYGIGKFLGLEKIETKVGTTECLVIEYADNDKLYVPVEDFHLVQKYLGKSEAVALASLSSKKWLRKKRRVKEGLKELAGELIHIYALRQTLKGYSYSAKDELLQQLEDSFIYTETEDQLKSIEDIKKDLEKSIPMDRLLCGDVGFGKTEVAVRAAFQVVLDSKQVAVLVPTTILAQQHLNTFSERLRDFPVSVEMLSRFRSKKRQNEILGELKEGNVDIIIGTHRLLSQDVQFKNLGLLVIDEEQRFGVTHKEKIKSMRTQVDVLTMTATPIPRTLYFSLSGARDISFINTPPEERLSVYTQVVELKPEIVVDAIHRELDRGGQVFFLHNRVQSIQGINAYLEKLLPGVHFVVAHGQMHERQLEKVFSDFLNKKYDVLVTTNIIESGTDIPNVNTIFINRADRFGLADLYQLRGRVGRSDQQAYAYLVIPPYRKITKNARKRISALLNYSDLGSGFQLALRDMEIRGSGNLLGKEQHGFIEEVGMTLYSMLLKEAIAEIKGQKPPVFIPIPIQTDFPVFIPNEYMPSPEQRIYFYQKAYIASSMKMIQRIEEEIADKFGSPPVEVKTIFQYLRLRLVASRMPVSKIAFRKSKVTVFFKPNFVLPLFKVDSVMKEFSKLLRFRPGETNRLIIEFQDHDDLKKVNITHNILSRLKNILENIS